MISYDYAMIAIGDNWRFEMPYSGLARQFTIDKNTYNQAKVYLTTNSKVLDTENLIQYDIDKKYPLYADFVGADAVKFNYNIKFLSVKNAFENSKAEYIIYIDSDFLFDSRYSEQNLQALLQECKNNEFDILSLTFAKGYRESFEPKYDILNISRDDDIITFQEGFLIFKNTYKLKHFLEKWEELYWILANKNVPQWAEALEIGISARYANFKFPDDMLLVRHLFATYMQKAFWTMGDKDEKLFFAYSV